MPPANFRNKKTNSRELLADPLRSVAGVYPTSEIEDILGHLPDTGLAPAGLFFKPFRVLILASALP
jgi:hypothetical protein